MGRDANRMRGKKNDSGNGTATQSMIFMSRIFEPIRMAAKSSTPFVIPCRVRSASATRNGHGYYNIILLLVYSEQPILVSVGISVSGLI